MSYEQIINNLKKKIYSPIYLLMGENTYYIDKITHFILDNFFDDDTLKDFNLDILYGKDTTIEQIILLSKQYPMMSNYRLIIIKEAQNLNKIINLTSYIQNPQKQTVLVLCHKYKNVDKRTSFYKAIDKTGVVFESPKIYDNQVSKYVKEMVAEKKYIINDITAEIIARHIGTDLSRINNELDKFQNIIKKGETITADLVQEYIGISKEYNEFELINAIWTKNTRKSFEIIDYFQSNPKSYPIQRIISNIYSSFIKLMQYHLFPNNNTLKQINLYYDAREAFMKAIKNYPYPVVKRIISLLKIYDLRSKGFEGYNISEFELLKELTFRIIGGKYTVN